MEELEEQPHTVCPLCYEPGLLASLTQVRCVHCGYTLLEGEQLVTH